LWLNWLEAESDNMRSALAWSLDGGRLEVGLRLAVALYDFWLARGHLAEGRAWSSRLLARSDESLPPILRARANMTVGHFSWLLGDYDAGGELQAAIDLAEAAGEPGKPALAAALMGMSSHIRATGDYGAAYRLCRRSVQLNRELGSTQGLIPALMLLAVNASGLGWTEEANSLLQQALALAQDQDDTHRVAMVLKVMGDLAYVESDYSQAQALYEDSLDKFGELGQANDVIGVSNGLAAALLGKGELKRAFELLAEGLRQQRKAGNIRGLAEGFVGLGALADMSHRPDVAVPLLAAATTRGGPSLLFSAPALKLAYERLQGQGRSLALDKAIQLALSLDSAITSTRGASPSELDRLTQRQRQVAALVAQGMSNEEIAQELVISKRTVEKHISDIFSRLDMGDRTQLVLWAIEQGLTSSTV
jgi:DNA-binding CsgD family transcriptional regulator